MTIITILNSLSTTRSNPVSPLILLAPEPELVFAGGGAVVVGLEVEAANEFIGLPAGEAKLVPGHTITDLVATHEPLAHYLKTYNSQE
jgi:hypothetical protein